MASIVGSSRLLQAKRRDETLFSAVISVSEVKLGDRSIFVGSIRNVEQELAFKKEMKVTDDIMNMSVVGILTMNGDGIVTRASKMSSTMFGYSNEELVGHNVKQIMPERIASMHDQFLAQYKKTGTSIHFLLSKKKKNLSFLLCTNSPPRYTRLCISGQLFIFHIPYFKTIFFLPHIKGSCNAYIPSLQVPSISSTLPEASKGNVGTEKSLCAR